MGDISAANLTKRLHTVGIDVGTTFSVHHIRLCILMNEMQATRETEKEVILDYVMECVGSIVFDQDQPNTAEMYPDALSNGKPPLLLLGGPPQSF